MAPPHEQEARERQGVDGGAEPLGGHPGHHQHPLRGEDEVVGRQSLGPAQLQQGRVRAAQGLCGAMGEWAMGEWAMGDGGPR